MDKIVVENLKYRYPLSKDLAIDNISFTIEKGEFIGVIGRNSAGKSTLCQAMVGLVPNFYGGAYGGKVVIDGMNIAKAHAGDIAEKVGIVFQNPFTQITGAKLTVYEEIAFGLENLGLPRDEMYERIEGALRLLDIYKYKDRNPFDLSGGQMQRMAIASIIAMKPDVIVFDEPTSQLDPQGSEEVFKAIQSLSRDGMTIIMVEHKMEKIAEYCDRVLLMDKGKIVDFGIPKQIFSRDDLENLGIAAPAFTQICRGLNVRNEATGYYPVTLKQAYELVVNK